MIHIITAITVCALDQLLKLWVSSDIPIGGRAELIPGVVHLTHIHNTGAAFSVLSGSTWLLAAVSAAASIILLILILKKVFPFWERFSLALILGGAVGNMIDRIVLGYVVDMFEVEFVRFAVFNVADVFIDVGAALFVILYIARLRKEEKMMPKGSMKELERLRRTPEDKDRGD